MFVEECTRDQLIIQRLIEQNKELNTILEERKTKNILAEKNFLQELIEQESIKNRGQKVNYREHMKKVALYIFILSGPMAYQTLQKNLPLPSITTLRRHLGNETPMQEGEFQVDMVKQHMLNKNEPLHVWVAEDDTKITSRLRYNIHDDTIVGLELPLDEKGIPIQSFFKFTSIKAVQTYLKNYPVSSYAKLITCRSLHPSSKPFQLVIYGTRGSEKSEKVILRWSYIHNILCEAGINLVGFSSDGFSAFLKSMQHFSNIPTFESDCLPLFYWFFFGSWNPQFLSLQDATHMIAGVRSDHYQKKSSVNLVIMIVQNELFSKMNYHSELSFAVFSKMIVHIDSSFCFFTKMIVQNDSSFQDELSHELSCDNELFFAGTKLRKSCQNMFLQTRKI